MFSNFVTFTEVVKLSQNVFNQMRNINSNKDTIDLILTKQDIVYAEQVINESNVSKFSSILNYCRTEDTEKWLDLIFRACSSTNFFFYELGEELLPYCCIYNKCEIIKYLLIKSSLKYKSIIYLINWSIVNDKLEIIKLINGIKSIMNPGSSTGYELSRKAVKYNRIEIVEYLIKKFNWGNSICASLIITSSKKGFLEITKLLQKQITYRDYIINAKRVSIEEGHYEIAKYLEEKLSDMVHNFPSNELVNIIFDQYEA